MSERRLYLIGWVLFLVCAVFYLAAAIQAGDMLTVAGSAIFLIACFFFMVPLMRPSG